MVGGQALDMQSETQAVDISTLEQIHRAKTGALLTFAVMAATDIAQVNEHVAEHLNLFSQHLD